MSAVLGHYTVQALRLSKYYHIYFLFARDIFIFRFFAIAFGLTYFFYLHNVYIFSIKATYCSNAV